METVYDTRHFKDREEAGQRLAGELGAYKNKKTLVLALPRGGVAIGYEIAKGLGLILDTVVVRKIGAPANPEYAVGALAPRGVMVLDKKAALEAGWKNGALADKIRKEKAELARQVRQFSSGKYAGDKKYETVILCDDGLATGMSALAAIKYVRRKYEPKKLIFAVPICDRRMALKMVKQVDEFVCLSQPEDLLAVGLWYESFKQLNNAKVVELLLLANQGGVDLKQ